MKLSSPKDPDFPWDTYVNHSDWSVRFSVAQCEHTPSQVLEKLVHDEDTWVVLTAVVNPNMTSELLEELSEKAILQDSFTFLKCIQQNKKCSERTHLMIEAYLKFACFKKKVPVLELST